MQALLLKKNFEILNEQIVPNVQESRTEFHCVSLVTVYKMT